MKFFSLFPKPNPLGSYPPLILLRTPVPLDRTCGQEQWSASPRVIALVYEWSLVRNSSPWTSRKKSPNQQSEAWQLDSHQLYFAMPGVQSVPRSRSWVGPGVGAPILLATPTQINVERDETGWESPPP